MWLLKRILLNLLWFIINIFLIIGGAILVSEYFPDWVFLIWLVGVFIYGFCYTSICTDLFDALIGDGF